MFDSGDRWLVAWSLGYAAVGAASVLVPLYAIELGADAFVVAVVAATAALAGVPGALVWGRLASRTGRCRPFLLASLGLAAVSFVALPLAETLTGVVLANAALQFNVAAAAPILALLVVSDHPDSEWDRRIGVLNTWQGYGWLVGLLAGAAWVAVANRYTAAVTAQRWFFYASAAACALATLLAWRWLPGNPDVAIRRLARSTASVRTLQRGAGRVVRFTPIPGVRSFWALRRFRPEALADRLTPALVRYLVAVTLFFTGFAVFFGPLPAYLVNEIGLTSGDVFALFLVASAASAVAYERIGEVATERSPQAVQTVALAVRGVLFPAVALASVLGALAFPGLVALFGVVGVMGAVVAVTGTSIVARLAPPSVRGDALGAYTALSGLGTAVGSVGGGVLATRTGYVAAFVVASVLVFVGAVLAEVIRRRRAA